uniref:Uncharacterized protein n=1 Tax=Angiostrongylus cantonensis TaxID=6313 RepID=A0A0K0CXZ7_ANGCA
MGDMSEQNECLEESPGRRSGRSPAGGAGPCPSSAMSARQLYLIRLEVCQRMPTQHPELEQAPINEPPRPQIVDLSLHGPLKT